MRLKALAVAACAAGVRPSASAIAQIVTRDRGCRGERRITTMLCTGRVPGQRSVDVALDRALVSHARVIGIHPGGPARAALVQQVPALVQAHPELLEPITVLVRRLATRLLLEQRVLLVRELVDPCDHVFVFHATPSSLSGPHRPTVRRKRVDGTARQAYFSKRL